MLNNVYNTQKMKTGFTIVELLIVIVVIGILAAITIVAFNGVQNKARVAAIQSDLKNSAKLMDTYKYTKSSNTETYPHTLSSAQTDAGIKTSGGSFTAYLVDNTDAPTNFCLTETNGTNVYSISSSLKSPVVGSCMTNLAFNSGIETGSTAGWTGRSSSSVSVVTTPVHTGTHALKVVTPGAASDEGVSISPVSGVEASGSAGTHIGSTWIKATSGVSLRVRVEEYTSSNGYAGGSSALAFTGTGNWQRVSTTYNVVTAGSKARLVISTPNALATTFYIDDAMVQTGSTLNDFFDGDSTGAFWTGAPSESSSIGIINS